eukprot:m.47273 g.47273  ORF g.47273 m.47273 type:complete len:356 (+) comp5964_c0_seq1:252-1319(+)
MAGKGRGRGAGGGLLGCAGKGWRGGGQGHAWPARAATRSRMYCACMRMAVTSADSREFSFSRSPTFASRSSEACLPCWRWSRMYSRRRARWADSVASSFSMASDAGRLRGGLMSRLSALSGDALCPASSPRACCRNWSSSAPSAASSMAAHSAWPAASAHWRGVRPREDRMLSTCCARDGARLERSSRAVSVSPLRAAMCSGVSSWIESDVVRMSLNSRSARTQSCARTATAQCRADQPDASRMLMVLWSVYCRLRTMLVQAWLHACMTAVMPRWSVRETSQRARRSTDTMSSRARRHAYISGVDCSTSTALTLALAATRAEITGTQPLPMHARCSAVCPRELATLMSSPCTAKS